MPVRTLLHFAIILLLLPVVAAAQFYDRCRIPRDLVFIIDHSGTMKNNDPDGLRWEGLRQLIRRLAKATDRDDQLVFVPFGSAKDTPKYLTKHGALRWFKLKNPEDRALLFGIIDRWAKESSYSDSTDIFAAFKTFEKNFYPSRRWIADLYIFFISDGRMDVGNPRRGEASRQQAIRARDRQLYALLQRMQNIWRIYSVCVGRTVDENRHRKILSYSKKDRRRSGLPYPPLGHTSPGHPYYLRVDVGDRRSNLALFKDSIWDALDIGGAELFNGKIGKTGVTFAPAAAEDYRFHFSLAQPMRPHEFQEKINLMYRIDKNFLPAKLIAEHTGLMNEPSLYLDYRVDTGHLAQIAGRSLKLANIREWKIEVSALPRDQAVVSLQIVQRHGWRVFIDSLQITPAPVPRRWLDRLINAPQPCSASLWASGWAYNECGRQNLNAQDQLAIEINNGKPYSLKFKDQQAYDQVTKEPAFVYYWQTPQAITGDPAFPNSLGATVTLGLRLSAFGGYLYQNHSIAVPVCAEYESERRTGREDRVR
ncbi:MAG: VWA domain-containing protein [candidate division KSB1 bacterium]|nr:VWA domain-containing protein [candidate division KSB1 bacterium]MDZ7300517.1 VWA domain-containing protein [candidate division KSB1 bacterium]MDZ7309656.1 VWA domain-containing protein [candidate division KSB1 bacterium]